MANAYYQITMQLVCAVKHREALILNQFKNDLHKYIAGILLKQKHKPLAINSMPDHIHILFGMHPCDIPSLIRDIKSDSSTFINQHKLSRRRFHWQKGYGLFSYSISQRPYVIRYIENQEEHHKKRSFRKEYNSFLKKNHVDFNPDYIFDFFD